MRSFFEPKSWWKYDIYWLLKSYCFELFGDGKYGIFFSQKVDVKMIFTDYWKVLVLNFSMMGNTVSFSAKKLMEIWYLLGLFELSMIFQHLRNMLFRAVHHVGYGIWRCLEYGVCQINSLFLAIQKLQEHPSFCSACVFWYVPNCSPLWW